MRVLTFGWDLPPATSGGLGFACHGLTKELTRTGIEVLFVLPRRQPVAASGLSVIFADITPAKIISVASGLVPYQSGSALLETMGADGQRTVFSRSVIEEAHRYAAAAATIAARETFDIIHAHDWTSYLAGLAAKEVSGKPLVLHVHATSFDQAGGDNVDPAIFTIEREAFARADSIVAVSEYTKRTIVKKHGAASEKVTVVHNGSAAEEPVSHEPVLERLKASGTKIVLFHGRITIQKGVDHFVRAARRVVDVYPDVVFVISGNGDMRDQIMHYVAALGLSRHVLFAGDLWYEERDRMYQSADLLVMPSVSEPFGLVPLEALQHGTPAVISKQSGVAEVLSHALLADFWDVDEMANKIVAALRYPAMHGQLVSEGKRELLGISWQKAAEKICALYHKLKALVTKSALQ